MTKGITIYTITEGVKVVVSGLTVKLVNPGDNWSSENNITLTEQSESGYYENSSVTSNQEGYYEVWHNKGGSGADSGQRVNVGMLNHAGLKTDAVEDNNIKNAEVKHSKLANDAVEDNNIKDTEVVSSKIGCFGKTPDDIVEIVTELQNTKLIETDDSGKIKSSSKGTGDIISPDHSHAIVKLTGNEGGSWKLMKSFGTGTSTIGQDNFRIDINVPIGAKIVLCQMRVDEALDQNWKAEYNDGSFIQQIVADAEEAMNTKVNQFYDVNADSDIMDSETDIVVRTVLESTFTVEGTVRACVYYMYYITMANVGA